MNIKIQENNYVAPAVKTVRIDNRNIICTSPDPKGRSNEAYEEEDESVTSIWFNN